MAPLLWTGCDAIVDLVEEEDPAADDPYFVEEETALLVAENLRFAEPFEAPGEPRELRASDFNQAEEVDTIDPLTDPEGEVLMYVVNYEGGGFAILSADRRVSPVLAYSESNSFELRESLYNPGLVGWMNEFGSIIAEARAAGDPDSELPGLMWDAHIAQIMDVLSMGVPGLCTEPYVVEVGPLLTTTWGQGCGYNAELDSMGCADYCGRPPTGCVATAVAQILKYFADHGGWSGQYVRPNGALAWPLEWDAMPDSAGVALAGSDVPPAMASIGEIVRMSYDCEGSGSTIRRAHDGFRDNFGFAGALRRDLDSDADYEAILAELDEGRPVYLRGQDPRSEDDFLSWAFSTYGDGHAWVADGYTQTKGCDGPVADSYLIRMNWGWHGSGDGVFMKKDGRFPHHREMIYNLVPPPTCWPNC